MKITKEQWVLIARAILIAALAIASILGYDIAIVQPREAALTARAEPLTRGISHWTEVEAQTIKAAAPTAVGTATPAIIADSLGVSNLFEARDAATPVFTIADGGNIAHTGNYALTGDHTVSGTQGVTGNQTLSALNIGSSTTVTVTDGLTITPTTSIQIWDAAGAVTVTLAACSNSGQALSTYGNDAQTITIADTNILTTDGNAATLGQYDIIDWVCIGTKWVHIAKSANS